MATKTFRPFAWLMVFILVVGMACRAGTPDPTPAPAAQVNTPAAVVAPQTPASNTAPQAETQVPVTQNTQAAQSPVQPSSGNTSGAAGSIAAAQQAVIQIESDGTFIDPQVGLVMNGAGRGSGFFIDPSGIAVTANHVVSGAGLIKVWVGGDTAKTYNARVLGVNECADLAVIQVQGGPFSYLDFRNSAPEVGTDLYLAGFPLGDPQYSLTRGIVSKAKADGKTPHSSVPSVISFDAATNPGNSGGPVLDKDGKVMGVAYYYYPSSRQALAIALDTIQPTIAQLRAGKNMEAIGVNGQAVRSEDGKLSGVWVSSVQSGSPADKAGLQAGDIIMKLENLVLATDGTMGDYCDILRSHNAGDTLNVQVLRWASKQVLDGQLNGRQLAVTMDLNSADTSNTSDNTNSNGADANQVNSSGDVEGNPNASGSGEFFYKTQFDKPDNWYGFAVPKTDNYVAETNNGVLDVQVPDKGTTVYALYKLNLAPSDVRVDTQFETVSGPNNNNISVVCRATDRGWYEFSVGAGGYWFIWKYVEGQGYVGKNGNNWLAQGASYAINLQKSQNTLTATCIGNDLTLYVNDTYLGSASDTTFQSGGQVGVSVTTPDNRGGSEVAFDWFAASVP